MSCRYRGSAPRVFEAGLSHTEIFYAYYSFAPPCVFRHDLTKGKTSLWSPESVTVGSL